VGSKTLGELLDPAHLECRDAFGSGVRNIRLEIIEEGRPFRWNPETRQRLPVDARVRLVTTQLVG